MQLLLIGEAIFWIIDMCCLSADIFSWLKGKRNRVERRDAKKSGVKPPPRDKWNRRVIGFTIAICIITTGLLAVRLLR